jgi:indolepyruvate ferredoxin oxidoreductase, beta subunit
VVAVADDNDFAREIVECQGVLKGYGATHEHGSESFAALMDAADRLGGHPDSAQRMADLRAAALADEDGAALKDKLAGIDPPTVGVGAGVGRDG